MLELVLSLDQFQTWTERSSPNILDFLGDVGGFVGAISILTAAIGQFFSEQFYKLHIAKNFFIRALSKEEEQQQIGVSSSRKALTPEKLKSFFKKIDISSFQLLFDKFFNLLVPFRCCKSLSCRKRQRIIEKSYEQFNMQLDLDNVLNFIRDTSSMLALMMDQDQKMLLRFAKSRTVKLSESDDSSSDDPRRPRLDSDSVNEKYIANSSHPEEKKEQPN